MIRVLKTIYLPIALLLFPVCFFGQTSKKPAQRTCGPFIYERLHYYFTTHEERPSQITNNTGNPEPWRSGTQKIAVGPHALEWIDEVDKNDSRSSLRINGELITLADKRTENLADGDANIELDMVGQWDQIRLYELHEQTIIAVSMSARQCTGLMCGVSSQLWYDIKTKQKTFLGTYRTDSEARLFRYPNVEAFYILSTNFNGDPHGVTNPAVVTYQLLKLQPNGQFRGQQDRSGEKYYLKHTAFPDSEVVGDTVRKRKIKRSDCLEQNWIEKVLTVVQ